MSELLYSMSSENCMIGDGDSDDPTYGWDQDIYDDCIDNSNIEFEKICENKDLLKIEGVNQRWDGRTDIKTFLSIQSISDLISHINCSSCDNIEIDIFEDSCEINILHHDGVNRYRFTPIQLSSFTDIIILELAEQFDIDTDQDISDIRDDILNQIN